MEDKQSQLEWVERSWDQEWYWTDRRKSGLLADARSPRPIADQGERVGEPPSLGGADRGQGEVCARRQRHMSARAEPKPRIQRGADARELNGHVLLDRHHVRDNHVKVGRDIPGELPEHTGAR